MIRSTLVGADFCICFNGNHPKGSALRVLTNEFYTTKLHAWSRIRSYRSFSLSFEPMLGGLAADRSRLQNHETWGRSQPYKSGTTCCFLKRSFSSWVASYIALTWRIIPLSILSKWLVTMVISGMILQEVCKLYRPFAGQTPCTEAVPWVTAVPCTEPNGFVGAGAAHNVANGGLAWLGNDIFGHRVFCEVEPLPVPPAAWQVEKHTHTHTYNQCFVFFCQGIPRSCPGRTLHTLPGDIINAR